MAFGVSDELLSTLVPTAVYWAYSGVYILAERLGFLEDYRLHSKEEEVTKNIVSRGEVVRRVILLQAIQIAATLLVFNITGTTITDDGTGSRPRRQQPPVLVVVAQIIIAMLVLDTTQYFGHRILHMNKFLYKHIHSRHHELIAPYAFGALYVHPLEGMTGDIAGSVLAMLVSGMTPRTAIFFFSFVQIKGVDDHCGMWFPGKNLFHAFFPNNSAFHDVHHQLYGTKFNFSTPLFTHWDKILGTYMPYSVEKRPQGGWEVRPVRPSTTSEQTKKE